MKRVFSKSLALLLVLAMALSFSAVFYADEPDSDDAMLLTTATLTASGNAYAESDTTKLYATSEQKFVDVAPTFWGYSAIQRCADAGIVNGIGHDKFAPDSTLTYAQFYVIMARAFYDEEVKAITTAEDNWYSASVRFLETNGLLEYPSYYYAARDVYNPEVMESVIPRFEMALLMFNMASAMGCDKYDVLNEPGAEVPRPYEWSFLPPWYMEPAQWAYRNSLIVGYGDEWFHGDDPVTRAQACTVACRLLDFVATGKVVQGATDPKPIEPPVEPSEPPVQPTEPPVEPSVPPVEPPASTVSYEEVKDLRLKDLSIEDAEAAITDGLFKKINEYRVSLGLSELPYSDLLAKGAAIRAEELEVSFSHSRPDGKGLEYLYEEIAGGIWLPGENIGMCHTNALGRTVEFYVESAFDGWLTSPGHERLLSSEDAIMMAVGCHVTRSDSSYYESDIYYVFHKSSQSAYEVYLYNAGLGPRPW